MHFATDILRGLYLHGLNITPLLSVLFLSTVVESKGTQGHIAWTYPSTGPGVPTYHSWSIGVWDGTTQNWNSSLQQASRITGTPSAKFLWVDFNEGCVVQYWCGDGRLNQSQSDIKSYYWKSSTQEVPVNTGGRALYCDQYGKTENWGVVWAFAYCCPDGYVLDCKGSSRKCTTDKKGQNDPCDTFENYDKKWWQ